MLSTHYTTTALVTGRTVGIRSQLNDQSQCSLVLCRGSLILLFTSIRSFLLSCLSSILLYLISPWKRKTKGKRTKSPIGVISMRHKTRYLEDSAYPFIILHSRIRATESVIGGVYDD